MRQGRLNVATLVMVNGRLASGFCSPALTWAEAATEASGEQQCRFRQLNGHIYVSIPAPTPKDSVAPLLIVR